MDKKYYTNIEELNKLYKILEDLIIFFDKDNIIYWADWGTLLGAIRHKSIIPWDDDIDISIFKKDEEKLLKLKPLLNKLGYDIINTVFGYKIFYINGEKIKKNNWKDHMNTYSNKGLNRSQIMIEASKTYGDIKKTKYYEWTYPFIDIYLTDKIGDFIMYSNRDKIKDELEKNLKIKYTDLLPLKHKKFGNYYINIPNNYNSFLNYYYGNDWNTHAYLSYNHKKEKRIKSNKVLIINMPHNLLS